MCCRHQRIPRRLDDYQDDNSLPPAPFCWLANYFPAAIRENAIFHR
jgi:hypothetical protein